MSEQANNKQFRYSSEEDAVLLQRARELAQAGSDSASDYRSLLSFSVGDQVFALDTRDVQQVVSHSSVLHVPQTPAVIVGIAHIRGNIITVCDTSLVLLGKRLDSNGSYYLIYVHHDEHPLSFAVAGMPESILVEVEDIEAPPPDDDNRNIGLIEAYVRHGNDYIQILSAEKLMQHKYLSQLLSSPNAEQL